MAPGRKTSKRTIDDRTRHEEVDEHQVNPPPSDPAPPVNHHSVDEQSSQHQSVDPLQVDAATRSFLAEQLKTLQEMMKAQLANEARREEEAKAR